MIDKLNILESWEEISGKDHTIEEKSIANDQNKIVISYFQLFRFASKSDWILIILGFIAAIGRGPAGFFHGYFYMGLVDVFIAESKKNEQWNGYLNSTEQCNGTGMSTL